jgi:hypothetical protein
MASGFKDVAVDLDSIFAPWQTGWSQAAATEFEIAGVDLNARYAKLSAGVAAAVTNFKESGGADLNTIFAAYGSTGVAVLTQPSAVSGSAAAGNPSGTVTSNTTTCAGSKGGGTYTYVWHIANGSGFTLTAPNSATTAITGTVPAGQSVSGQIYCTISDGVTSINTNTVNCSLQNTTSAYIYNGTVSAGEISTGSGSVEIRQFGWSLSAFTGGTVMGSISPGSDIHGNAIGAVYGSESGSPIPYSYGTLLVIHGNLPQNYFAVMVVDGDNPYASSSASYSQSSGYTFWSWTGSSSGYAAILASGGNHSVTIQ